MNLDITTFEPGHSFYTPKYFLATVKSFNLQGIRARYLKARKSNTGRIGSVERREVSQGGLVYFEISKGKIDKCILLGYLPEPRGIDVSADMVAVSSENKIHVIAGNDVFVLADDWFSYIHTIQFDKKSSPENILISSSGYDCIFEFSLKNRQKTWEWFAWENGFSKAYDSEKKEFVHLSRDPNQALEYQKNSQKCLLIRDPINQTLPTAKRAAFINSVLYDENNKEKLLATFFHEGSVYRIDRPSGKAELLLTGLKNPHGGRNYQSGFMATSTTSGEVFFNVDEPIIVSFSNLVGKPPELQEIEWLQNSAPFDDCIITIDSNRSCFVIYDLEERLIDRVQFDPNWAIQDLSEMSTAADESFLEMIKQKL